jgi:hypothetical protein
VWITITTTNTEYFIIHKETNEKQSLVISHCLQTHPITTPLYSHPDATTNLFSKLACSEDFIYVESAMSGFLWLTWLSFLRSWFIHVVACTSSSFLLVNKFPFYGYTTYLYPLISWWTFKLFHLLAVTNNATMHIPCNFLGQYLFSTLQGKYLPRSGIAR